MKKQLFLRIIFLFIFHTDTKLTDDNDLLCKFTSNPYIQKNSLNDYQAIEQEDILKTKIFQQDMLNDHNIFRRNHYVPPLVLDDKISKNAQAYAEYLAKQDSRFIHRDRKNLLGENLYSTITLNPIINPDANKVTQSCYNEIVNYNFDLPGSITNIGNFKQIVWKDTKKLGNGIAFAREGRKMYVVAQYSPPGNYPHAFNANILPTKCSLLK